MSVKLLVVVIIDFKRYPSKKVVVSVVVICRISKITSKLESHPLNLIFSL